MLPGAFGQVLAIGLGIVGGLWLCRDLPIARSASLRFPVSTRMGWGALGLFAILLIGLPLLAIQANNRGLDLVDGFFRAGALVFGGGHVVLPLLQAETVAYGWLTSDALIAGYGATQAMLGPLFTFAAFLGTAGTPSPNGLLGTTIALIAIFVPGGLIGVLPFSNELRSWPLAQAGMRGANATVVGILSATLYNPVFVSAVLNPFDFALVTAGFAALVAWKAPPWVIVAGLGAAVGVLGLAG
ncbi:MAG: chromate transporter [Candidatus Devosia symbiotica]|nr:chromate transporter [Candidatus Devosia symbiotica]